MNKQNLKVVSTPLILRFFLYTLLLLIQQLGFAQNLFEKKTKLIEGCIGIGGHNITLQTGTTSSSINGGTFSFPITCEYGILDQIGIGAEYQFNNYYLNEDASDKLHTNTLYIINNLHFKRTKKFDFSCGAGYGLGFHSLNKKSKQIYSKGAGFGFEVFTACRWKLKQNLLLSFKFNIDTQAFSISKFTENGVESVISKNAEFYTYLGGYNFMLGLACKLPSSDKK